MKANRRGSTCLPAGMSPAVGTTSVDRNGALLFSSSWTGTQTAEQTIDGGNIQVPHIGRTPTQK